MEMNDQSVVGVGELPPQPNAPSNNNVVDQRVDDFNVPMGSLVINEPEVSTRMAERSNRLLALDKAVEDELKHAREKNPNLDTKKIRRTVSNRLSAERSRLKRSQYINALEQRIAMLQQNIHTLSPMVEHYKNTRQSLLIENCVLQETLNNSIMQAGLRDMEISEKEHERDTLRELAKAQGLQQMINNDPFFTNFQSAVVEGTSLQNYAEPEMQEDMAATMSDQFLNFDAMNEPPNHFPF